MVEHGVGSRLIEVRKEHDIYFFSMFLEEFVNKALFVNNKCIRHDVLIRHIAIRNYMPEKIIDSFYVKLEKRRIATMSKDRDVIYNPYRFPNLIDSFIENGFLTETPIIIDDNYEIIEGAHRLACCIFFNINRVPLEMWRDVNAGSESWQWFINNFTEDELKIINNEKEELYVRFCKVER